MLFPHEEADWQDVDFNHLVPGRRLIAHFQPQQWIKDNAVDSDSVVDVDVTEVYLGLSVEERAAIQDNRDNSDALVLKSSDVWEKHGGTGYVEVQEAIIAFHAEEDEDDEEIL
jgi:hypothetical protein